MREAEAQSAHQATAEQLSAAIAAATPMLMGPPAAVGAEGGAPASVQHLASVLARSLRLISAQVGGASDGAFQGI